MLYSKRYYSNSNICINTIFYYLLDKKGQRNRCELAKESSTTIDSDLLSSPLVNSKFNLDSIGDVKGIDQQQPIKNEIMSSERLERDILVNYCLVNDFDRFSLLRDTEKYNDVSSVPSTSTLRESSNEVTDEEITEGEGKYDDIGRVIYINQEPILEVPIRDNLTKEKVDNVKKDERKASKPMVSQNLFSKRIAIQKNKTRPEVKNFNQRLTGGNLEEANKASKNKVIQKVGKIKSIHAISDQNSVGSSSLSLFGVSDDSLPSYENSKKFSVQKVKRWQMLPRLCVHRKTTSLKPQKKIIAKNNSTINSVNDSHSQSHNTINLSKQITQTKRLDSPKCHSSSNIQTRRSNRTTNSRRMPIRCQQLKKNYHDRKAVKLGESRSLCAIGCIENRQKSLSYDVVSQKIMNEIINMTGRLKDHKKSLLHGDNSQKWLNTHQSPSGDNPIKVNEKLVKNFNNQPISLGSFVSSCDLRQRRTPANASEELKNEYEILRNKLTSKMKECDKLLLRNLKRKVSESVIPQGEMNEIEEKRKRETIPSSERDSLGILDDENIERDSSKKRNQDVQDLNKIKIVTNILNSLSKTKTFSSREDVSKTKPKEEINNNNSSADVTPSNCKKSVLMMDENGNSSV
ncbi:uncharacterized protein LOC120351929 isoform X2 [Nilaparvata lugens]|uniref:uncharacterized protein LOC120351929 isoform X2 n=1 Tax=Nilaparvata lugens TaxID=108931 RepID=UPI00193E3B0C|nr:uncharacterized protein LOC120351929 isoform X2 [Nilaparvata lugens]